MLYDEVGHFFQKRRKLGKIVYDVVRLDVRMLLGAGHFQPHTADSRLARALGAHAGATVRERYGWGNVATQFSLICQDVLREWRRQNNKESQACRLDAIAGPAAVVSPNSRKEHCA